MINNTKEDGYKLKCHKKKKNIFFLKHWTWKKYNRNMSI